MHQRRRRSPPTQKLRSLTSVLNYYEAEYYGSPSPSLISFLVDPYECMCEWKTQHKIEIVAREPPSWVVTLCHLINFHLFSNLLQSFAATKPKSAKDTRKARLRQPRGAVLDRGERAVGSNCRWAARDRASLSYAQAKSGGGEGTVVLSSAGEETKIRH